MTDLTLEELAELERLANATDDAPWTAQAGHLEDGGQCAFGREHALCDEDVDGECDPQDVEEHRAEQDAAFIALASPTKVLVLLAMARELVRLKSALDHLENIDSNQGQGFWETREIYRSAKRWGWSDPFPPPPAMEKP